MDEMKRCKGCKLDKPRSEFSRNRIRGDGLNDLCRPCASAAKRRRKGTDYDALLARQGGICPVCEQPPLPDERLFIDHDHTTGQVRGLLHRNCNVLIGLAQEDIHILMGVQLYLERHHAGVFRPR